MRISCGRFLNLLPITGLFLIGLASCAHKDVKKDAATTQQPGSQTATASDPAAGHATGSACTADLECPEKHLCINNHCVAIHPGLAECSLMRVRFDFNDAALKPEEVPTIQRMARCLKADHGMKLDIRGNADERGTEEYNLALGDKRARVVARYLENLGVSESQLNTVSYGKERPLCTEHNEDCWQQNRRTGMAPK